MNCIKMLPMTNKQLLTSITLGLFMKMDIKLINVLLGKLLSYFLHFQCNYYVYFFMKYFYFDQ